MFDQEGGDNLFDAEFVVVRQAVNLFPILQQFLIEQRVGNSLHGV